MGCQEAEQPASGQVCLQHFNELIRGEKLDDLQALVPFVIVPLRHALTAAEGAENEPVPELLVAATSKM